MSDNPSPEITPSADAGTSNSVTNVSGGVSLDAQRDVNIGGDVVGRDKIVSSTTIFTGDQQYDVHSLANPYLGLQSFTYADHAKYAGREKLIAETVKRLTAPDDPLSLLFITGASGSGKSSFVQAGVLPALEKHYTALSVKWAVFRPSRDPLAALSDAMWRQLGLPQFDASTDFGDFLHTHTPPQQVNVIVIDQFEELFTQSNAQPRDALFNLLTHLPPFLSTRAHVIATVRADYLPELFTLPALYDIAKRGIDLRAMSVDELREAIQQPLRATYPDKDKRFQAELVDHLAKDAAEDAAYLPLLQVTLDEIWRKGTLTFGSYTNLADAIKQRADKVLEFQDYDAAQPSRPRPPEEQAAILNLCLDLVDVSLDDEPRRDVRRRRTKDELISSAPERARLIDTLAQARLLSVRTDSGEQTRVEVDLIHETLLSNWDRLRQTIAERRHELRQRARFEQQLREWNGHNRSNDYLLSGVYLAEARELESCNDIAFNSADARHFVRRSVVHQEARHQKELSDAHRLAEAQRLRADEQTRSAAKLRKRATYLAGALVIAAALGIASIIFGVQAGFQQRLSRSRGLAAVAISQLNIDPERSILLALEANNVLHTFEAEDALRQSLLVSRIVAAVRDPEASISGVQFLPNGLQIVTGCCDVTARVWKIGSGKELVELRGHEASISSAQFSPDGKYVVTASYDGTARVWDTATGKEVAVLRGHNDRVIGAQFSPDGKQIVTFSADDTARVWKAATGKEVAVLGEQGEPISSAQFSPDGRRIITLGYYENVARIWDVVTAKVAVVLRGHEQGITSAQFSSDGSRIVTASVDGTARVWETATGKEVIALGEHTYSISYALFSPDSLRVLTDDGDHNARIWDVATGKKLTVLVGHDINLSTMQFSPDGSQVVTASYDKTVRLWEAATGKEIAVLHVPEVWGNSAQFSPDGKRIATVSGYHIAQVWDMSQGKEVAVLSENERPVSRAGFSPDGRQVVRSSDDNTARVWDTSTWNEVCVLRGHEGSISSAQFSPDGRQIVTGSYDKTARIWDATTGVQVAALRGHASTVFDVQFSPDGKKIVTASNDATARVWDTATGREVAVLRGHEASIFSAQFSPDGLRIVTASEDGTARVWDTETGREVTVLRGHENEVSNAQFSPDGKLIVTASWDRTARVWDTETGREVAVLRGHERQVTNAQFSSDGKQIMTDGYDGITLVYVVHIEDLIALAKMRVTRELTCEERVQYLNDDRVCPTPTPEAIPTP